MTVQSEKDGNGNDWSKKWKSMLTIIILCWAVFAAWASFTLIGPFFPREARLKGMPASLVGFAFGVYELVIFLTSPIFGFLVHKVGHKFMFISGMYVCGTCSILFGFLTYCPPGSVYIAVCFVTRATLALGNAAFLTACYTLAVKEFPDRVTFIVGILETFIGVGVMVGPVIGGAFYDLGGFGLPFYAMGGVVLLTAILAVFILTEHTLNKDETVESLPIWKLFFNVGFIILFLCSSSSSFAWTFIEPTLADRLAPFRLSTTLVGVVFLVASGVYAISAPMWGWVADKYGHSFFFLLLSIMACAVAQLLLGPAPFLGLPFALWLYVLTLCLMGFWAGCTMVMIYRGFIDVSVQLGFEQNLATYGCISGIFNSSLSLGAFLGPTVGGMLNAKIGFAWTCVVIAVILLPVCLLLLVHFFILPKCCAGKQSQPGSPKNEKLTLMSSLETQSHTLPKYTSESSTESNKSDEQYNVF